MSHLCLAITQCRYSYFREAKTEPKIDKQLADSNHSKRYILGLELGKSIIKCCG